MLPASLSLDFCGLALDSPIVLLSGCVGFGEEYTRVEGFTNRDAGAIVLKGTTAPAGRLPAPGRRRRLHREVHRLTSEASIYEAAGGEAAFTALVGRFYAGVAGDPVLRPLYPKDPEMFAAASEHLRLFLIQYWGGPTWYSEQRGHPRLRMRHQPFAIGRRERDAWMGHMRAAVESLTLPDAVREAFLEYFENAATAMMNRGGPPF